MAITPEQLQALMRSRGITAQQAQAQFGAPTGGAPLLQSVAPQPTPLQTIDPTPVVEINPSPTGGPTPEQLANLMQQSVSLDGKNKPLIVGQAHLTVVLLLNPFANIPRVFFPLIRCVDCGDKLVQSTPIILH